MANSTIDNLPASVTPIPRTTPLPGVIAGVTEKVTIEDLTGEYEIVGTLLSADVLTVGTIPVLAVPVAPVGYYARIIRTDVKPVYTGTVYAGGETLVLETDTATKQQFGFSSLLIATGNNTVMGQQQNAALLTDVQLVSNKGIYWTTQGGADPTLGTTDYNYRIRYELVAEL